MAQNETKSGVSRTAIKIKPSTLRSSEILNIKRYKLNKKRKARVQ